MKLEAGKTYITRDGQKVRVVCTDIRDARYPVIGLQDCGDYEAVKIYTADGRYVFEEDTDENDIVREDSEYDHDLHLDD